MPIGQQPNEVQLRLVVDMIVSSGGNEIHLMRGLRSFRITIGKSAPADFFSHI